MGQTYRTSTPTASTTLIAHRTLPILGWRTQLVIGVEVSPTWTTLGCLVNQVEACPEVMSFSER